MQTGALTGEGITKFTRGSFGFVQKQGSSTLANYLSAVNSIHRYVIKIGSMHCEVIFYGK